MTHEYSCFRNPKTPVTYLMYLDKITSVIIVAMFIF